MSFVMKYADNIVKVGHDFDHIILALFIFWMHLLEPTWAARQFAGVFYIGGHASDRHCVCLPLQFPSLPRLLPRIDVSILSPLA